MNQIRKFEYKKCHCIVYDGYQNDQYIGQLLIHGDTIWTDPVPQDEGTPRDVVDLLKITAESHVDNND